MSYNVLKSLEQKYRHICQNATLEIIESLYKSCIYVKRLRNILCWDKNDIWQGDKTYIDVATSSILRLSHSLINCFHVAFGNRFLTGSILSSKISQHRYTALNQKKKFIWQLTKQQSVDYLTFIYHLVKDGVRWWLLGCRNRDVLIGGRHGRRAPHYIQICKKDGQKRQPSCKRVGNSIFFLWPFLVTIVDQWVKTPPPPTEGVSTNYCVGLW